MASFVSLAPTPTLFESLKFKLLKSLTLTVFFCLPRKLTNVFVSLSIVTLILKLRDRNIRSEQTLLTRIEQLLKINLSDNILVFPDQTVTWFWTNQVLATEVRVQEGRFTLRELLFDETAFMQHRHLILNTLLNSLPLSVRYKLKLSNVENRIAVKHNIISALRYA